MQFSYVHMIKAACTAFICNVHLYLYHIYYLGQCINNVWLDDE